MTFNTILLGILESSEPRKPIPSIAETLFLPCFLTVSILSLLPPPGPIRVGVTCTIFTSMWCYAFTHWTGTPSFFLAPMFAFGITLRWALMVFSGTPELDYHQVGRPKNLLMNKDPLHKRLLRKLRWSAELWGSWRGIGWNFEDKYTAKGPEQYQSRHQFLITNVAFIALNKQIESYLVKYVFCYFWPQQIDNAAHVEFYNFPMLNRRALTACHLLLGWVFLETEYRKYAVVSVGLHLSTPDSWKPFFGNLADVYSVRTFWGRWWHQAFRNLYTLAGDQITSATRASKGTLRYKYTKLYTGYLVSGVQHYMAAVFVLSPNHGYGMFLQMPLYAAVVTAEDVIKFCGKKSGVQDGPMVRTLGYIWTAYWMTYIYGYVTAYHTDIGSFSGACS